MRFEFDGLTYQITFSRERKFVQNPYWRGIVIDEAIPLHREMLEQHPEMVQSKFPYTTARLDVVEQNDPLFPDRWHVLAPEAPYRTATVGCITSDKFHPNAGRIRALRLINRTIPKEMLPAMWLAYNTRKGLRRPLGLHPAAADQAVA